MDKKTALGLLENTCRKQFGCELKEATKQQVYKTLCMVIKDILILR
jgi:starch phosphorylase